MRFSTRNSLIFLAVLVSSLTSVAFARDGVKSADASKQEAYLSQKDPLFDCSSTDVDKQLHSVINEIRVEYANEPGFIEKLEDSQRIWEEYRLAYLKSVFPKENARLEYGSIFSRCWCFHYAAKTHERIKELQLWLDKVEEGDVCSGSVRFK